MRKPLVVLAVTYICGVVTGDYFPLPPLPFLVTTSALTLFALALPSFGRYLLLPVVFLTGATNLYLHTAILSPRDVRRQAASLPGEVRLRGRLCATPEIRTHPHQGSLSLRTIAQLDITAIHEEVKGWTPAEGKVLVTTRDLLAPAFYGGRLVEVSGLLAEPDRPVAPGLFDYRQYLRRHGIYFQLSAASSNDWSVIDPEAHAEPWSDQFIRWAKPTLGRGFPTDDPGIQLVWAMALGWKTALNGEVAAPFMRSGTMHVFAVSGLHISLIALILVALLRTTGVPRSWCGLIVIPAIWFYTAAIGWQASAVRSTLMMSVIIAGWSLRRPPDVLNSLAAAALLLLLVDPQQLFHAGFQLSFFVVLSLALFAPLLKTLAAPFWEKDPFAASASARFLLFLPESLDRRSNGNCSN